MDHTSAEGGGLYMVPRVCPGVAALHPYTFVGDVELTNIAPYIRRWHVTDDHIVNSSVPMNMLG
jgi:hypothetical protein